MNPTEEQTYRQGIQRRLDSQDSKLDQILAQTTKTNGRVTELERQDEVRAAQMRIVMRLLNWIGGAVAFALASVVVPIAVAYINSGRL
jgi:hypothetical protein